MLKVPQRQPSALGRQCAGRIRIRRRRHGSPSSRADGCWPIGAATQLYSGFRQSRRDRKCAWALPEDRHSPRYGPFGL